jgi:ParB family transcriptional regulator, chromosome partitioning protein
VVPDRGESSWWNANLAMSKMKPVLGRGLASLIPRQPAAPAQRGAEDDGVSDRVIARIALDRIDRNPYQPRADFDPVSLDELKRSIQEKGIIQPITVRRREGRYQLISGERRVRAARDAGLSDIPAYILQVDTDEEMLELALIENLQREHLNPIEIAISYKRLIDECHLTQEVVSQRIGKDRTTITNSLRLLKLPGEIQQSVRTGELSAGHARAILGIEDEKRQLDVFHKAVKRGLSVRQVEGLVREKTKKRSSAPRSESVRSSLAGVEERLRHLLGTKVLLRQHQAGKGEIVIEYYSADDLERILELFEELHQRSR